MTRPDLRVVPWASGDRQYFVNEGAYQDYLKKEQQLKELPLTGIGFDWRFFLKVLFSGG